MAAVADLDFTDPMRPGEVAKAFGVKVRTITKWADDGHLAVKRGRGGHRSYCRPQVQELLGRLASHQMRIGEVVQALKASRKSVIRWAEAGHLTCVLTPGGQGRYSHAEVTAMTNDITDPMTPGEVTAVYGVDPKALLRMASTGKIAHFQTPGGDRRYSEAAVKALVGETIPGGEQE